MTREELFPMLNAYRDGDITQGDAERLTASMQESEEVSQWVASELETEGFIAQALDDTDSESFLRGFWERQRAEKDGEHFVHDFTENRVRDAVPRGRCYQIPRSRFGEFARHLRRPGIALAASIVLLLAAGVFFLKERNVPVAHLAQVRGNVLVVRDNVDRSAVSNQSLLSGDGLRITGDESSATIVLRDGTRLEFGEDTVVTSITDDASRGKRVVLSEGFFTAQVAKQPAGKPMILATPHSEVVVLGTTFSLSVGTAVTHLETQSGNVRLKRTSDGRSVEVPAGFDAIVAAVDEPLVAQPFTPRSSTPRLQMEGYWTGVFSPKADVLAATRYIKGDVEFWNVGTRQQISAFRAHHKRTTAATYTSDGQTLVTGSLDGSVKWWDRQTGQLEATLSPGMGEITELALSREGRSLTLLSHREEGEARIMTSWDVTSRQQRWGPKQFIADRLAFSPDGRLLAAARKQERLITVWDLDSGEVRTLLRENGDRPSGLLRNVFSMAFSHDGRTLAVDDMSGLVSFWDLTSGQVRDKFQRHGGRIFGMGFSPDDRLLATGQQDDIIRIWDIAHATPVAALAGHSYTQARDVTFASDGRTLIARGIRLATGDRPRDGTLQLWDVPASLTPTKTR